MDNLSIRVSVFGAKSSGRTLLAQRLAYGFDALFEEWKVLGFAEFDAREKFAIDGKNVEFTAFDTSYVSSEGKVDSEPFVSRKHASDDVWLLVYDITNAQTFSDLRQMVEEQAQAIIKDMVHVPNVIVCGNKADLESQRAVPSEVAKLFADGYGFRFIETSAMDRELFLQLASMTVAAKPVRIYATKMRSRCAMQ